MEEAEEEKPLVEAALDHRRLYILAAVLAMAVLGAVAAAVGFTQGNKSSKTKAQDPRGELLVSYLYTTPGDGSFASGRMWRRITDQGQDTYTVEGNHLDLSCFVDPCKENDGACRIEGIYKEGCCMGNDCPEETKCGELCPPDACIPVVEGCISKQCYICQKNKQGQEIFKMAERATTVICIDYGTSTTPQGHPYRWIIACTRIVQGGAERENRAAGEYQCIAFRKGDGIQNIVTGNYPCQFIQLGECDCAPLDVYPFGLDPPTHPCRTQDECRFLCSDVPESPPIRSARHLVE